MTAGKAQEERDSGKRRMSAVDDVDAIRRRVEEIRRAESVGYEKPQPAQVPYTGRARGRDWT